MQIRTIQKRRGGRPKADEAKVKKHNLTVRLCDTDLLLLDEKARQTGLSYSKYLREAGLSRELPQQMPEISRKSYLELGRIGSNLNQFLKRFYEGNYQQNVVIELLNELTLTIKGVRNEIKEGINDRKTG